ncbi:MAG: FtsQ-type POTRA domain-containing protein [bacterium]|nr:FtsQ-type POTRA domain-containing protein [bacterium]
MVLVVLYVLFLSSLFAVDTIEVQGDLQEISEHEARGIASEMLSRKVLWFSTASIFSVPLNSLEQELESRYPALLSAKVQRHLPRKLSMLLQERESVVLWCQGEQYEECVVLDRTGKAFRESREEDASILFLTGNDSATKAMIGDSVISSEKLSRILQAMEEAEIVFRALAPGVSVHHIVTEEGRIEQVTTEGWSVIMDLNGNTSWQGTKLAAVLEDHIKQERRPHLEYIDLQFGSQAYLRYRDSK